MHNKAQHIHLHRCALTHLISYGARAEWFRSPNTHGPFARLLSRVCLRSDFFLLLLQFMKRNKLEKARNHTKRLESGRVSIRDKLACDVHDGIFAFSHVICAVCWDVKLHGIQCEFIIILLSAISQRKRIHFTFAFRQRANHIECCWCIHLLHRIRRSCSSLLTKKIISASLSSTMLRILWLAHTALTPEWEQRGIFYDCSCSVYFFRLMAAVIGWRASTDIHLS